MTKPLAHPPHVTADDRDADIRDLISQEEHERALRLLMQRHGDAVYRFVRSSLRNPSDADDVHQRVFIEAHRDFGRYAGRSSLRAWLFGIAHHRVCDANRSGSRARKHVGDGDGIDVADPRPSAGQRIDDARLEAALAGCLAKLGEHVRSAVVLRYQQGLSFEELGEILGEKPGTVQARVARALPVLRECIRAATGGDV